MEGFARNNLTGVDERLADEVDVDAQGRPTNFQGYGGIPSLPQALAVPNRQRPGGLAGNSCHFSDHTSVPHRCERLGPCCALPSTTDQIAHQLVSRPLPTPSGPNPSTGPRAGPKHPTMSSRECPPLSRTTRLVPVAGGDRVPRRDAQELTSAPPHSQTVHSQRARRKDHCRRANRDSEGERCHTGELPGGERGPQCQVHLIHHHEAWRTSVC